MEKSDDKIKTVARPRLPADNLIPQAVMQTPKQLQGQMERDVQIRKIINDYIKNNMVEGKDYGTITVTSKSGKEYTSKPSLFKPGAEKFCGLFKIRPAFKKDPDTVDMLGNTPGVIAYICELVDSRGRVIGEGRGTSSVDPKGADFDVNKAVKIAQKRAQVDAVLRTGGLSDFFTQDMEDVPKNFTNGAESTPPKKDYPASDKQIGLIGRLKDERFETEDEFEQFAQDTVGATKDFSLKQASNLIAELFKVEKLPSDEETP